MDIAEDEMNIETRVAELIERGLERYGNQDIEGALAAWKHAQALDPDCARVASYIKLVEDHYDLVGSDEDGAAPSIAELDYPFGVASMSSGPVTESFDEYESIEVVTPSEEHRQESKSDVDDGWNVDDGWSAEVNPSGDQSDVERKETSEEEEGVDTKVAVDVVNVQGDTDKDLDGEGRDTSSFPRTIHSDSQTETQGASDLEMSFAELSSEKRDRPSSRAITTLPEELSSEMADFDISLSGSDDEKQTSLRTPKDGLNMDVDVTELNLSDAQSGEPSALDLALANDAFDIALDHKVVDSDDPDTDEKTRERSYRDAVETESSVDLPTREFGILDIGELEPSGADVGQAKTFEDEIDGKLPPTSSSNSLTFDDELTMQHVSSSNGGDEDTSERRLPRPPTVEPSLSDIRFGLDSTLLSLEDVTGEITLNTIEDDVEPEDSDDAGEEKTREFDITDVTESGAAQSQAVREEDSGVIDLGLSDEQVAELDIGETPTASTVSGILAELTANAPVGDVNERTSFIVTRLIEHAEEMSAAKERSLASKSVIHALDYAADNAIAQKLVTENERQLVQVLVSGLGDLSEVPRLLVPMTELPFDEIDHRAAFLLTRMDETMTLEELLDVSGMPRLEALRHLTRLYSRGFLVVEPR